MSDDHAREASVDRYVPVLVYAVIGAGFWVASRGTTSVVAVAVVLGAVGLFHAFLVFCEAYDAAPVLGQMGGEAGGEQCS